MSGLLSGFPAAPLVRVVPGAVLPPPGVAVDGDVLHGADAVAVPIAPVADPTDGDRVEPRSGTADVAARYAIDLAEFVARQKLTGSAGETAVLTVPTLLGGAQGDDPWRALPRRIVVVGVGDESARSYRRAGAALARAAEGWGQVVTTIAAHEGAAIVSAFVEGYLLAGYRRPRHVTSSPPQAPDAGLVLVGRQSGTAVETATLAARATSLARDLANTTPDATTPQGFAQRVEALAADDCLSVQVWDEDHLAAQGFGALAAVGAAADAPPRLVQLSYRPPGRAGGRHVVLVGAGLTFDTGGLALRRRESMAASGTVLAGAAAVVAAVLAAAASGIKHRVTALLPLAENAFGANALHPSDVVEVYGGTNVEVLRTDEIAGLLLADALAYADATLAPDLIVDVAASTMSTATALGSRRGALFSSDEKLADQLSASGETVGEALWRLPIVDQYRPALDSAVADVRLWPADAGARPIMAALFLKEFVGRRRWAHLDIAGPARSTQDKDEISAGATGFGTRTLLHWLTHLR